MDESVELDIVDGTEAWISQIFILLLQSARQDIFERVATAGW